MLTLIRCPFHPRVTAVARKRPRSFYKSAGGRLHLNTHTLFTQRSRSRLTLPLSRHSVGTYQENELTRNSSRNTQPESSQVAEPLWTDPGSKSEISVRELISAQKKKKKKEKRRRAMNGQTFSPKPRKRGIKASHHTVSLLGVLIHSRIMCNKPVIQTLSVTQSISHRVFSFSSM